MVLMWGSKDAISETYSPSTMRLLDLIRLGKNHTYLLSHLSAPNNFKFPRKFCIYTPYSMAHGIGLRSSLAETHLTFSTTGPTHI